MESTRSEAVPKKCVSSWNDVDVDVVSFSAGSRGKNFVPKASMASSAATPKSCSATATSFSLRIVRSFMTRDRVATAWSLKMRPAMGKPVAASGW